MNGHLSTLCTIRLSWKVNSTFYMQPSAVAMLRSHSSLTDTRNERDHVGCFAATPMKQWMESMTWRRIHLSASDAENASLHDLNLRLHISLLYIALHYSHNGKGAAERSAQNAWMWSVLLSVNSFSRGRKIKGFKLILWQQMCIVALNCFYFQVYSYCPE